MDNTTKQIILGLSISVGSYGIANTMSCIVKDALSYKGKILYNEAYFRVFEYDNRVIINNGGAITGHTLIDYGPDGIVDEVFSPQPFPLGPRIGVRSQRRAKTTVDQLIFDDIMKQLEDRGEK